MFEQILVRLAESSVFAVLLAALLWWITQRQDRMLQYLSRQTSITQLLIVGLQKELLAHDLTVSGVNPSTGSNSEERDSAATKKYEEIRNVFDAIERQISMITHEMKQDK